MVPAPLRTIPLIGYVALLWLLLLSFPAATALPGLDPSWRAMLGHDWLAGLSVSEGSNFSYGPLGYFFVTVPQYHPELFVLRVVVELTGKLVVALLLFAALWRIEWVVARWTALVLTLLIAPILGGAVYLLALVAATLLALDRDRVSLPWYGLCFALVTLLGAAKHNMLAIGALCSLALWVNAWRLGGRRALLWTLLGQLTVTMLLWVGLAGQSPFELLVHLRVAYEVVLGYNHTLVRAGSAVQVGMALAAGVGLLAAIGLIAWRRPARLGDWLQMMVLAFAGFVAWKYCVVHHGAGQATRSFAMSLFLVCLLPPLARRAGLGRRPMMLAAVPTLLCALFGLDDAMRAMPGAQERGLLSQLPGQTYGRASFNLRYLSLGKAREFQEAVKADYERRYALPGIKDRVGSGTIDQAGYEQAILFLNGLKVHHRPAFQSYFANTEFLIRRNAEFYAREGGPDFVLFKLQSVHEYLDMLLDGSAMLELLHRYQPVLAERPAGPTTEMPRLMKRDYLLFERRDGLDAERPVESLSGQHFPFGEWRELGVESEGLLTARVFVELSLWGRLRANLYQAPICYIEARFDDGSTRRRRFSTTAGQGEFLLSPMVSSTGDFLALYTGVRSLPEVRAIRLVAEDGQHSCFADQVGLWLHEQPRPDRVVGIPGRGAVPGGGR